MRHNELEKFKINDNQMKMNKNKNKSYKIKNVVKTEENEEDLAFVWPKRELSSDRMCERFPS